MIYYFFFWLPCYPIQFINYHNPWAGRTSQRQFPILLQLNTCYLNLIKCLLFFCNIHLKKSGDSVLVSFSFPSSATCIYGCTKNRTSSRVTNSVSVPVQWQHNFTKFIQLPCLAMLSVSWWDSWGFPVAGFQWSSWVTIHDTLQKCAVSPEIKLSTGCIAVMVIRTT